MGLFSLMAVAPTTTQCKTLKMRRLTQVDSIVSRCSSGQKAVSRAAYLLFYRRRSPVPLGPPSLQQIVASAGSNQDSEEDEGDEQHSNSPTGNGLRLGDSSRNGSSSAGAVAAGVEVLRGGGSQLSAAGSHLRKGTSAESLSEDEMAMLPSYADEGYHEAEDTSDFNLNDVSAPSGRHDQPLWSFQGLNHSGTTGQESDDAASDAPNLGSLGGDDLSTRMLQDFGDDIGTRPGMSTPIEGIPPLLGGEDRDDDVAEIRLRGD